VPPHPVANVSLDEHRNEVGAPCVCVPLKVGFDDGGQSLAIHLLFELGLQGIDHSLDVKLVRIGLHVRPFVQREEQRFRVSVRRKTSTDGLR
jgi:hypothetical protein